LPLRASARQLSQQVLGRFGAFRVGFVTSALNPKIALFYGSVFATALPPAPSAAYVVSAVALVYVNSVVWHTFLAWGLSRRVVQQAYVRHYGTFNRTAAALVGVFGVRLLVATAQEMRTTGT
jgi:threonine efflux protein